MKNRLFTGVLFILLGLLIAFGPQTIFPVCGVHTSKQPAVQDSASDGHQNVPSGSMQMTPASEDAGQQMTAGKTVMKCHWTGRAEIGIGLLIALVGFFLLVFPSVQVRLGLSLALVPGGILALLLPLALIGVCGSSKMTCRSLTLPALILLGGIAIAASLANMIYLYTSDCKGRVGK